MRKTVEQDFEPNDSQLKETEVFVSGLELDKPFKLNTYIEDQKSLSTDPFTIYLREISKIKLLTPQREYELAVTKNLKPLPNDPPEVAAELSIVNQEAIKELTERNTRLVVSIARKYIGRGVPLMDLVQEGNIGLRRGIERFDPEKGRLTTYVTWWIRQGITRYIADQGRSVRLPVHVQEKINKLNRIQRYLRQELMREPTFKEIGKEMGMTEKQIEKMILAELKTYSIYHERTNITDDSVVLSDSLVDPDENVEEEAVASITKTEIRTVPGWDSLDQREKRVLILRFGLDDGRSRTLEEVGKELGVTRERARQLEDRSLEKLRTPENLEKLRGML